MQVAIDGGSQLSDNRLTPSAGLVDPTASSFDLFASCSPSVW